MKTSPETAPEGTNAEKTQRIRTLNDTFRTTFIGGRVMLTQGVQALAPETFREAVKAVQTFSAFSRHNDPWGEHDFGAFDLAGQRFFWKIDTYDKTLTSGSEDPSDPAQTTRVLTLMLAEEY